MPKRASLITEARVRQIIYEELYDRYLIDEGLWDDVQVGAKKLVGFVSRQFKAVGAEWAKQIVQKLSKLDHMPDDVKIVFGALKQAMQETGESFKMNDALKQAQELSKLGSKAVQVVQNDLETSVHQKAKESSSEKQSHLADAYAVLASGPGESREPIHESLTVATVLGVSLAIMGGLPMLFKGLHKLAGVLGAHGAAELFEKAEHVTHAFESKVIDLAVPDKLSYGLYKVLLSKGIKLSKTEEPLSFEEFQIDADKSGAMKKAQGLIYKTLLAYFAFQGLTGVLHAGASLLGFVEGAATSVKGVELARGAQEIAKLVRAGASGAAAV